MKKIEPGQLWVVFTNWGAEIVLTLSGLMSGWGSEAEIQIAPVRGARSSVPETVADFRLSAGTLFEEALLAALWNVRPVPAALFEGAMFYSEISKDELGRLAEKMDWVMDGEGASVEYFAHLSAEEKAEMDVIATRWDTVTEEILDGNSAASTVVDSKTASISDSAAASDSWLVSAPGRYFYVSSGGSLSPMIAYRLISGTSHALLIPHVELHVAASFSVRDAITRRAPERWTDDVSADTDLVWMTADAGAADDFWG